MVVWWFGWRKLAGRPKVAGKECLCAGFGVTHMNGGYGERVDTGGLGIQVDSK